MNTEQILRDALQAIADQCSGVPGSTSRADCMAAIASAALLDHDRSATAEPADPMDWRLPCDVTVGCGTNKAGTKLRTLVTRMKVLHGMAMENRSATGAAEAPGVVRHVAYFRRAGVYGPWVECHSNGIDAVRFTAPPSPTPAAEEVTGAAVRIMIDYKPAWQERGQLEVIAEEFTIPGVTDHRFAVHNTVDQIGEYTATHIGTGFAVGRGESPDYAIELARKNWLSCNAESLALKMIRAKNISKVSARIKPASASNLSIPASAIDTSGERVEAVDTARLDWLEAHCTGASDSERYLPFRIYWGNKGATTGIRAQIDKARKAAFGAECMELGAYMAKQSQEGN